MQAPLEIKKLAAKYDVIAYRFSHYDHLAKEYTSLAFLCEFNTVKKNKDLIAKDLGRIDFIGTQKEYSLFKSIWTQSKTPSYSQGDMACSFPTIIFNMAQFGAFPEKIKFIFITFAFVNKQGIQCGFTIHVRDNNPKNWMIGISINCTAMPKDRDVILYLTPYKEWEVLEEGVDLVVMKAKMLSLKHIDQCISLEKMRSTIIEEINSDSISSIVSLLIENDCTINMALVHIIKEHFEIVSHIEATPILDEYNTHPPIYIQSTLRAKTIIGCEVFLQTSFNLPHNSGIRSIIRNLLYDLQTFPNDTIDTLEKFFATTEETSSKYSATSCILLNYIESDFLRKAFKLEGFSKEAIENSEDQRIRFLEIIKENIGVQQYLKLNLK